MLEASTRPPKVLSGRVSQPTPEDTASHEFIAQFTIPDGEFRGSLIELAAQLRAGKIPPVQVPLLTLTRSVLERYHALRAELEHDPSLFDTASEALPHLAGVIELKTRLLLPKPPVVVTEDGEPEGDTTLESVLEGVEMLARLEGAIAFLRDRRRERSRMIVPGPQPLNLPRKQKPLSGRFGALVEAARRRVREVHLFDLALERLNLPQALERLRDHARRVKRFFFRDVPAQDWGERTVLFAAMLEGVRAGELQASQTEPYAEIEISRLET
jgi:segregation and condensation protein A